MPTLPVVNPALALTALEPWLFNDGRHSKQFQALVSDEEDFYPVYDSFVMLAMFAYGAAVGDESFSDQALSFERILEGAVHSGVTLSTGDAKQDNLRGGELIPFVEQVLTKLRIRVGTAQPHNEMPTAWVDSAEGRVRLFDTIAAFIENIIDALVAGSEYRTVTSVFGLMVELFPAE
jgi:hypothetical protein